MSFFGLFSGCSSIVCCSNRDQGDSNNQNSGQLGEIPPPQRMKQLILDSQRNNTNNSFLSEQQEQQSYQDGTNQPGDTNQTQFQNTQTNEDPTDGFIEITPIFQVPKLGSSGSENQENDFCPEIDEGSNGSLRHQNSQQSYSSASCSPHHAVKQQEFSELVSLPVNYSTTNNTELIYHGASSGNRQQVELRAENNNYYSNSNTPKQQKSYKETIRSRNSSQHSQDRGDTEKKHKRTTKAWTEEEDRLLRFYYSKHNGKWEAIANELADRNTAQCSQRWRRIKPSKIRRPWTPEEDVFVMQLISQHGKNWGLISSKMDNRSGKQVRERYINKLDPSLNNDQFTEEEDKNIIDKYYKIGPRWSEIAKYLQGRSENMVKNRFYSFIKKAYIIHSLQGGNSEAGSQYDASSPSPRVLQNQEDKNSSYVSSNYNDLEPSVGSEYIESQESLSDNEQKQNSGINSNNNSNRPSSGQQQQFSNFANQANNNNNNNNNNNFEANLNSNQNNIPVGQGQEQILQQNQLKQEQQFENPNPWGMIENVDQMFRTPRQALANNSSFFPSEIFFQQQNIQEEGVNGQQQQQVQSFQQQQNNEIDTNTVFVQGNPSPLLLLSPAQLTTEQFLFPPNPNFLLSNNYQQQQQQSTYHNTNTNNNNHNPNNLQQYAQNTAGSNNNTHLNGSLMNNFDFNNNPTNLEVLKQQQQQLAAFNSLQNQQNQQQIDQTGIDYNFSNGNASQQFQLALKTTFEEPLENQNSNHQRNFSGGSYVQSSNQPDLQQQPYQLINSQIQNTEFNGITQHYQQSQQSYTQQSNNLQFAQPYNSNNDSNNGFQFNTQNYQNSNGNMNTINQNGLNNGNYNMYAENNQNLNNQQLGDFQTSNSQENLRLEVQGVRNQENNNNQAGFQNGHLANAPPKINRRQLNTLIVDLETQLQLLRVKQQNFNDADSDC